MLAGIVATICFLAAAILFSTLAACFVNKQRKRKLKRKKGEPVPAVIPSSSSSFLLPVCVVVVTLSLSVSSSIRAHPQVKPSIHPLAVPESVCGRERERQGG